MPPTSSGRLRCASNCCGMLSYPCPCVKRTPSRSSCWVWAPREKLQFLEPLNCLLCPALWDVHAVYSKGARVIFHTHVDLQRVFRTREGPCSLIVGYGIHIQEWLSRRLLHTFALRISISTCRLFVILLHTRPDSWTSSWEPCLYASWRPLIDDYIV